MSTKFKPLKLEDFNLKPGEIEQIVVGSQTFLGPVEDPMDDELFSPIDQTVPEGIS